MNNKIGAFTKMCCTIGNLPSSYMMSMTYEEQLLWLCNYLEKTVIPAVNNNAEAVEELQRQFNLLKSYVDNYFDNLDVQQEINNKLDDMAESGELTDIIAQYLQLAGILAFNTLSDLAGAENLNDGSFTKIYGKLTYNDGLGAFYKIRHLLNTDVIDGDNLVALTNYPTLVAEKMPDKRINDIEDDIADLQERIPVELDKLVIFGDSWSDEDYTTTVYPTLLAQTLNLDLVNYAVSGSYFINPTNNKYIKTQVETFQADSTVDKTTVKYIILEGGLNDYRNDNDNTLVYQEIQRLIDILKQECPQAKILYISNCEYPYTLAQSNYWARIHKIIKSACYIATLNLDGIIEHNLFNSTYFHLTNAGQRWLSSQILCALTGGDIQSQTDIRSYTDSDIEATYSSQRIGDMFFVNIRVKTLTATTGTKNIYINTPDDLILPFGNDMTVNGFAAREYQQGVCGIVGNRLIFAVNGGSTTNGVYLLNIIVPIQF